MNKPQLTEVTADDGSAPPPRRGASAILAELRSRKVCRTAISYMLVMWLNLQIGDVIFPMLGFPDWSLSLVIVIGVMGFPVMLILAWVFQVTPAGIVVDRSQGNTRATERQLDTAINCLLLLCSVVLSGLLLLQFTTDGRAPLLALSGAEEPTPYLLSALDFQAAADDEKNRTLADGLRQELRHRLINMSGIEVLPKVVSSTPNDGRRRIAISGSLTLEGSTAHVLANLIDLTAGRYLMSITFNVDVDSTFDAGQVAAERIAREIQRKLLPDDSVLASAPTRGSVRAGHDDPA